MYVDSETPTCTVKWSPSPSVAADDARPLGQLADGRTQEETDGDNQDDALRLMDGWGTGSINGALSASQWAPQTENKGG